MPTLVKLQVATSNPGKIREYREMAAGAAIELEPIPGFASFPAFEESFSTFAENSAGKAIFYSRFTRELVIADDSGLVVPALDGAPGVHSARYAGANATDSDRVHKLVREMKGMRGDGRRARFVCVLTLALQGRVLAVLSGAVDGVISEEPRGADGFGYDPVFYFPQLGQTYAEISREQKNEYSHRGRAFRKLASLFSSPGALQFI